ncbi:TetR/AcrR family transcriptional regulator [Glycomyces luteolus]|uniref:TetR/AcrR family transcriptional regulator n=1 Tax=Glycomyces luteolus TaxID=2670330 RepID=A0A9X3SRU1_9ACTN|nr:TetR/AcrR family transcriptional regulator [Glycomyces luteolus]MDA1360344.1 TetR/AcrR family transcriptional regulator [Glycomyces luteolus]
MSVNPEAVDRRAALKAKSRKAILDAAAALMRERRSTNFSVDELAAAADVSRRTVFNHFDSLEAVVTAVAGHMLVDIVDAMEAEAASGDGATVLDDLAAAASADHLVPTVAYLIEILGGVPEHPDERGAVLMQRALALFTAQMPAAITRRHPHVDELDVALLVAAYSGGLLGLVERWAAATGGTDTPESQRLWNDLLARLVLVLREPAA